MQNLKPNIRWTLGWCLWLAIACAPDNEAYEGLPRLDGKTPDPARLVHGSDNAENSVCLKQIRVPFIGAFQAHPKRTKWTQEQALMRATRLSELARCQGVDFSDLAKLFSSDADTKSTGGVLGVVQRGFLHPDLEEVAFGLGLGQVSDPILTPKGYHILMRVKPTEAQVSEVLISYTGAKKYTPRTSRTRQEARALAQLVISKFKQGEDFADLAQRYSDLPNYKRGGFYPIFSKGTQHAKLEEIAWSLKVGSLSDIVETSTGFHIVYRQPVVRIRARIVRVGLNALGRDELHQDKRALVEQLQDDLVNQRVDFTEIANRFQYNVAGKGGLIDWTGRGVLPYSIEKVAFALAPGMISDLVETPSEFFIIKRLF